MTRRLCQGCFRRSYPAGRAIVIPGRNVRRGQVLFTAGDPSDTLILVISGRVKVVVRSADGAELTLTIIQPGSMFGEIGIADGGPRSADAEALEDCRCCSFRAT